MGRPKLRAERVCEQCGEVFERRPSELTPERRFCSGICAARARALAVPTRAALHIAYWVEKKSTPDLATQFGVSKGTIYNWFKLHDIPTRSDGEGVTLAQIGRPHTEAHKRAIGRGHEGKPLSADHKAAISRTQTGSRRPWLDGENNPTIKAIHARRIWSRAGLRPDLGFFVRSRWEGNTARWLNYRESEGEIAGWAYETHTFRFPNVARGPYTYTPDFLIVALDGSQYFLEVKGYMDPKSKSKLARMAKHFPTVVIELLDRDRYRSLATTIGLILPHWESGPI